MKMLKHLLSFMSGVTLGLIAGYITGTKRDIYLDFKDLKSLKKEEDSSHKEIKKDLSDLKTNYDQRLNELTEQVKERVEELKKITMEKE